MDVRPCAFVPADDLWNDPRSPALWAVDGRLVLEYALVSDAIDVADPAERLAPATAPR